MTEESSRLIITLSVFAFSLVATIATAHLIVVLKQFRQSMEKIDQILSDISFVSNAFARPVSTLSRLIKGFKQGSSFFKKIMEK